MNTENQTPNEQPSPQSLPLPRESAEAIITEFLETLPGPVARDLEDVDVMLVESRTMAVEYLADLFEDEPITEEEFPLDAKGAFIGSPHSREDSDESEEEEVVELASGVVVINLENIRSEDECRLVLLHEFGHALGMSEEEVAELGLGVGDGESEPNEEQPNA
jgi:predicted Zn-dependent protease with MMP-like domain